MIKTDLDFILMCIVIIALGVGLISQLIGRAVEWYDRIGAWWDAYCQRLREERGLIMSRDGDDDEADVFDDDQLELPVSAAKRNSVAGVATPNNAINAALRVADERNAAHNGNDDITRIEQARIDALATLIVASKKKAFQDGRVPETRGLTSLFGVSVSSDPKSEYQRLRKLLKQRLEDLEDAPAPKFRQTPEQAQWREDMGLAKQ